MEKILKTLARLSPVYVFSSNIQAEAVHVT